MTKALLKGIIAPVVTAFSNQGAIDANRSTIHCHWLLQHGCDALVVFGTTSEANSLSLVERKSLLEAIVDSGIAPAQLLVGTGSCALPDAVDLTKHALKTGCSSVLLLPPFYYKPVPVDGLFAFFAEFIHRVADSRLRIYLYHIPPVAQVGIPFELIEKLKAHFGESIAGIKDSSGDWENTRKLLTEFANFDVFTGNELVLLRALRLGAAGCISGTANIGAETMQRLYRGWQTAEAEKIQFNLSRVREAFQRFPLIPALKAVLAGANNDDNWRHVRPPLLPLSNSDSLNLARELEGLEFSLPQWGSP
jgi:4-hydroxy-tetrahydrodipicolinate synthase